jgi:hypothetical protein
LLVVGDQQQRRAGTVTQTEHQVDHAPAAGRIEVAGRLVGEQDVGVAGERPRQRHALLLTAGQLARQVIQATAEADLVEQRGGLVARVGAAPDLQRQGDILERRHAGQQLERLEHEADPSGAQGRAGILVERGQVFTEQLDPARRRQVQAGEQAEQRRLAGAGRAENSHGLAGVDLHVDGREYVQPVPIGHVDVFGERRGGYANRGRHDLRVVHPGCCKRGVASPPTILVVGDSLSAGYGIERQRGWVALLGERLPRPGCPTPSPTPVSPATRRGAAWRDCPTPSIVSNRQSSSSHSAVTTACAASVRSRPAPTLRR